MWGFVTELTFTALEKIWRSFRAESQNFKVAFTTAILTIVVSFLFLVLWNIISENSFELGMADTEAFFVRSGGLLRTLEESHVQVYLRREAKAQQIILDLMKEEQKGDPTVSRLRLALIHNGNGSLNPIAALKYDVTATLTSPGYGPGPVEADVSLLTTSDFIDALLREKCQFERTSDLSNEAFKTAMLSTNTYAFFVCPIVGPDKQVLGFITQEWVDESEIPKQEDIEKKEEQNLRVNKEIAIALEAANT